MSYKSWLKRKENATPYANEANCRRCIHGEWVRTSAFCNGNGRPGYTGGFVKLYEKDCAEIYKLMV